MGKVLFIAAIAIGLGTASWNAQASHGSRVEVYYEWELAESNEAVCDATGEAELTEALEDFDSLVRRRDAYFSTIGFIGYEPYFLECVDSEGLAIR